MSHRETRWILAVVAFAAAGLFAWFILRQDDGWIRLADGRAFRIVGVTYGTNHVFEQGPPWARLVARFGSENLASRLGYWASSSSRSASPSVMVWTRWSAVQSNAPPKHASVVDIDGTEIEPVYATMNLRWRNNEDRLVGWRFENFPRHRKELAVRFYEYELFRVRSHLLSEVAVYNPSPAFSLPDPAPSPPVTAKDNALECTLIALRAREWPPRIPLSARNAIGSWATAEFEFRENGQPTTGWTIKRIDALSVSGNFLSNSVVVNLVGYRRRAHFTGVFWTNELDWTITAEVLRTRNFPAESFWTLRLPTRLFLADTLRTNLQSLAPEMRQFDLILGPSTDDASRIERPDLRQCNATIYFTAAVPGLFVDIANAVDDRGAQLALPNRFLPWIGALKFDIEVILPTEFIDLTFAIHHSRKLEFRVQPEWASTNGASGFPPATK